MIKTPLAPCPACVRHVRVTEPSCPFCRAGLPSSFRDATAPLSPATRLSRAALYALQVGTLSVTTVACAGAQSAGGSEKDSGPSDATSIHDAAYGSPPPDGSEESGQDDAPTSLVSAYGGPVQLCDSSADCVIDGQVCATNAQLLMLLKLSLQTCESPADDSGTEGGTPEGGSVEGGPDSGSSSGGDSGTSDAPAGG